MRFDSVSGIFYALNSWGITTINRRFRDGLGALFLCEVKNMLCEFDNCKKMAKATKLSKRLIRLADNLGLFDVGYSGDYLTIAEDATTCIKPFARIKRTNFGKIGVFKWTRVDHETTWYDFASQADAFLDAISWINACSRNT